MSTKSSAVRRICVPLTLAGVALALLVTPQIGAHAQDDPRLEARLLVMDGKFGEAEDLIAESPEDVRHDVKLMNELGSLALRWTMTEEGVARRPGLEAAKVLFGRAMTLKSSDVKAAEGALEAAITLSKLELEAAREGKAAELVAWAIASGEMALEDGATSAVILDYLGKAVATRASNYRKVDDVKKLAADYKRAGELFAEAAAATPEDAHFYFSAAASARLAEAKFIHDRIPVERETRDDKALQAAAKYAAQACDLKNAKDEAYFTHLSILRLAVEWETDGDFGEPYMKPLTPPLQGLEVLVPKSQGWKRTRDKEWDLILTRHFAFADEHNICQIKVKAWEWSENKFGQSWQMIETICQRYYESASEDYVELKRNVATLDIAELKPKKGAKKPKKKPKKKKKKKGKKKDPEVWHFRVAGQRRAADGRLQQRSEFLFHHPEEQVTYHIRVLDWDMPWGLDDPDVSKVIESMCGFPVPPRDAGSKKKKRR